MQRVYVQRAVYEAFAARLKERAGRLKIGDPLDEDTQVSALINQAAADRLKKWLEHAVSLGAKVHSGGDFEGAVMTPTVLTDVPRDAEFNCEEAFVMPWRTCWTANSWLFVHGYTAPMRMTSDLISHVAARRKTHE